MENESWADIRVDWEEAKVKWLFHNTKLLFWIFCPELCGKNNIVLDQKSGTFHLKFYIAKNLFHNKKKKFPVKSVNYRV